VALPSSLAPRHIYDETIERVVDLDLAGQTAVDLGIDHAFKHGVFGLRSCGDLIPPAFGDMDMTRTARAGATAVCIDPWDAVLDGSLHDAQANGHLDSVSGAIEFDVSNLRHDYAIARRSVAETWARRQRASSGT